MWNDLRILPENPAHAERLAPTRRVCCRVSTTGWRAGVSQGQTVVDLENAKFTCDLCHPIGVADKSDRPGIKLSALGK
jgi:hypothetical protein